MHRIKFTIVLLFLVLKGFTASAQQTEALGTFTPYSLFGIGEIEKQGTSFNKGMGGIGVGVRDNRYINYTNPAAITARDTLSFMLDFGVSQKNFYNTDGDVNSAFNTANMQNIMFTAPIKNKSAFIVGITPYSNIGYKFRENETNPEIVAKYGDIAYEKYGNGSINQFFIGAATNIGDHISIGAEMLYYFGTLTRNSNVEFVTDLSIRDIRTGWDYSVNAISGRAGAQYFNKFGKVEFTAGAAPWSGPFWCYKRAGDGYIESDDENPVITYPEGFNVTNLSIMGLKEFELDGFTIPVKAGYIYNPTTDFHYVLLQTGIAF